MLLPTEDAVLARSLIDRGIAADTAATDGGTSEASRNVRAATYGRVAEALKSAGAPRSSCRHPSSATCRAQSDILPAQRTSKSSRGFISLRGRSRII